MSNRTIARFQPVVNQPILLIGSTVVDIAQPASLDELEFFYHLLSLSTDDRLVYLVEATRLAAEYRTVRNRASYQRSADG